MAEETRTEKRPTEPAIAPAEVRARLMMAVALDPYQEWRRRRAEDRQPRPAPA